LRFWAENGGLQKIITNYNKMGAYQFLAGKRKPWGMNAISIDCPPSPTRVPVSEPLAMLAARARVASWNIPITLRRDALEFAQDGKIIRVYRKQRIDSSASVSGGKQCVQYALSTQIVTAMPVKELRHRGVAGNDVCHLVGVHHFCAKSRAASMLRGAVKRLASVTT
jgi:hypothetical protein